MTPEIRSFLTDMSATLLLAAFQADDVGNKSMAWVFRFERAKVYKLLGDDVKYTAAKAHADIYQKKMEEGV
jgi:hypothetical protein